MKPLRSKDKPEVFQHTTTVILAKSHSITRRTLNQNVSRRRNFSAILSFTFLLCLANDQLLQLPISRQSVCCISAVAAVPAAQKEATNEKRIAQDVTQLELDASSGLSEEIEQKEEESREKMKSLDEFLESLPTLSVGQKHSARFECELNKGLDSFKLIWLKLNRLRPNNSTAANSSQPADDIMLISLNQKIITPDKRFKVRRQSPLKWILNIDNVGTEDNHAYYLCQVSASEVAKHRNQPEDSASRFAGGARLNVLVPPRIVEQETSASLVQVNEFDTLILRCKVISEPQSQLMWKREDGKSVDGLEQRFKHETERKPNQILSIDSSELIFGSFARQQSGAYLCIASNGVQPGVSQRMNVETMNCRASIAHSARIEPCDLQQTQTTSTTTTTEIVTSSSSSSKEEANRKSWRTSGKFGLDQQRRQQRLQADKRRAPASARNDGGQVSIKHAAADQAGDSTDLAQAKSSTAQPSGLISPSCSTATLVLALLLLHSAANIITALQPTFITTTTL